MASYTFEEGYPGPKARHLLHHKPQVLINILDGIARVRPATPYGEYPISITGYDKGLRRITHGELANAVNGAAWWLTEQLGHGKDFQTLCYMGWKDFRYVVFILGAVKVGYKVSDFFAILLVRLHYQWKNYLKGIGLLFYVLFFTLATPSSLGEPFDLQM